MAGLIVLARHASHAELGRRLSGRSDIALSAAGRLEAARLAEKLDHLDVAAIHSSPTRRAVETAEIVAGRVDTDVNVVAALDEIDFGRWTGRSFDDLDADPDWRRWNAARGATTPPCGEGMASATARAVGHVEATAAAQRGSTLLVSHCDIIRGIVAHYLGLALDLLLRFDVDPASLTTLEVTRSHGRVLTLNERP